MCSPLLTGMWSYFYFLIFSKFFILFFRTIFSDLAYQTQFPLPFLLLPHLPSFTPIGSSECIRLPTGSQHSVLLYFLLLFFSIIVFIALYILLFFPLIFSSTLLHFPVIPHAPHLRGDLVFFSFPFRSMFVCLRDIFVV